MRYNVLTGEWETEASPPRTVQDEMLHVQAEILYVLKAIHEMLWRIERNTR